MSRKRKLFLVLLFLISFSIQIPNGQVAEVNRVLLSAKKVSGNQDHFAPAKAALISNKVKKQNKNQQRVVAFLQKAKINY